MNCTAKRLFTSCVDSMKSLLVELNESLLIILSAEQLAILSENIIADLLAILSAKLLAILSVNVSRLCSSVKMSTAEFLTRPHPQELVKSLSISVLFNEVHLLGLCLFSYCRSQFCLFCQPSYILPSPTSPPFHLTTSLCLPEFDVPCFSSNTFYEALSCLQVIVVKNIMFYHFTVASHKSTSNNNNNVTRHCNSANPYPLSQKTFITGKVMLESFSVTQHYYPQILRVYIYISFLYISDSF